MQKTAEYANFLPTHQGISLSTPRPILPRSKSCTFKEAVGTLGLRETDYRLQKSYAVSHVLSSEICLRGRLAQGTLVDSLGRELTKCGLPGRPLTNGKGPA